jgi:SNF2 family DNA or RNA helicase
MLDNKRVINADEMGAGKTGQAIMAAEAVGVFPVIIVCPSNLKPNWKREIGLWTVGRHVTILEGKKSCPLGSTHYVIVNYDILPRVAVRACQAGRQDCHCR